MRSAGIISVLCTPGYGPSALYIRSLPHGARAVQNFREFPFQRLSGNHKIDTILSFQTVSEETIWKIAGRVG
jgi:hypothetical protein